MSAVRGAAVRRVTIVVPMRNEAHRVEGLVDDIAAQDFAGEIETFVADGESTDGSVAQLQAAAARAGVALSVLPNPARTVAPGLNACIARATGDLVVRLDCKSRYPADYVRRCALAAEETGAWNVGGLAVPGGQTATERAVACAMDSPFGGIGWTRHRAAAERVETDTVYLGAFRPQAFARVGDFRDLGDNHDDEFNVRLRRGGGRVVFDPSIRAYYTGRPSLGAVFSQYYRYGRWKVPVMVAHRRIVSGRSLAPAAFVSSLALLAPAARRSRVARRLLAAELAAYAGCSVAFAAASVKKRGEPWRLLPRATLVFPTFHVAYGVGMLRGALSAAGRNRSGRRSSRPARAGRARARGSG
jgi:glycosyltransferase involved in cell wall biosynthesis